MSQKIPRGAQRRLSARVMLRQSSRAAGSFAKASIVVSRDLVGLFFSHKSFDSVFFSLVAQSVGIMSGFLDS